MLSVSVRNLELVPAGSSAQANGARKHGHRGLWLQCGYMEVLVEESERRKGYLASSVAQHITSPKLASYSERTFLIT